MKIINDNFENKYLSANLVFHNYHSKSISPLIVVSPSLGVGWHLLTMWELFIDL